MITNDTTGRTLLVGDEVRMVPHTLLSAGRPSQQKRTGRVTQLVNDGTSVKRINVVFENIEPIEGVDEDQFEKVLPSKPRSRRPFQGPARGTTRSVEKTDVTEDMETLQRGMAALRDAVAAGWEDMAGRPLGPNDRWEIGRYIDAAQDDLALLLTRLAKGRRNMREGSNG